MSGATGEATSALAAASSTPNVLAAVGSDDKDHGASRTRFVQVEPPFALTCVRHGLSHDRGPRTYMQDVTVVLDDLAAVLAASGASDSSQDWPQVTALYAVFDGHGMTGNSGSHASQFAAERIVRCLAASEHFPSDMGAALREAILSIEVEYWGAYNSDPNSTGGTTALVAVVWGNTLHVANAGDCRAVLSQQGKALVLTRDHRPTDPEEKKRIIAAGGYVNYERRVGGVYSVSRVIGDFCSVAMTRVKGDPTAGRPWPLTAEPEITQHKLGHQDEFMIVACDGFWDYQGCEASQRPVDLVRSWLQEHNSPQQAAEQLMKEVLPKTQDNVTIVVVCFGQEQGALKEPSL